MQHVPVFLYHVNIPNPHPREADLKCASPISLLSLLLSGQFLFGKTADEKKNRWTWLATLPLSLEYLSPSGAEEGELTQRLHLLAQETALTGTM